MSGAARAGIVVLAMFALLIVLSQPGQAAVVKSAYIACAGSNSTWVLNLSDGTYLRSGPITVDGRPTDIAVDQTSSYVYVLNYDSCSVSIISTATNTVDASRTIDLTPYHPIRIVLDPQREYAYVLAERSPYSDDGRLFVINTYLRSLAREIGTTGNVRGLAISHNGSNYLVMVRYLNSQMEIRDADTLDVKGQISLSYRRVPTEVPIAARNCTDAAFTPAADWLYVAHDNHVSVVNVSYMTDGSGLVTGMTSSADLQVDSVRALTVDPLRGRVYATSRQNLVAEINRTVLNARIFVDSSPGRMAVDGNTLYVCNNGSNSISVIDMEQRVVRSIIPTGEWPAGIAIASVTVADPTPTPTPTPTPAPTPGPRPLQVNVSVAPNPVSLGTETGVTVSVMSNETPVKGAGVTLSCPTAQVVMLSGVTADDGKCFARLIPVTAGMAMLTVTVNGSGYQSSTIYSPLQIAPATSRSLSLKITVSPQPVQTGVEAVVTVTVLNGTDPVGGAAVTMVAQGGAITPSAGATTNDGRFLTRFSSALPGYYFIAASANASGYQVVTGSESVAVVKAQPKRLYTNVSIEPQPIDVRNGGTITVEVTDGSGPVSGAGVSITCIGADVSPASGATGSNGKFSARFMPADPGSCTLNVVAMAGGFDQASSNVIVDSVQSMDAATMIFLVVLTLAIVAVILLGIIFFLRRWFSSELQIALKKTRIPADGMTRMPLRATMTNGFRLPRKMPRDTEVEFETTGGTIRDVIIHAGHDGATTEITSARAFGPVYITARAGGRTATARAELVPLNGALEVTVSPTSIPADNRSSATVTIRVKDGVGNYLKPLEDTVIELVSTLGDALGSVTMPAGVPSATATIVSGDMTGVAVIAATMGDLRGEAKLEFVGLPKRYCMHCGTQMTLEATACPACSQVPPSGVDTKQCPTCGTVIPEKAQFCYKCGAMQSIAGLPKKVGETT